MANPLSTQRPADAMASPAERAVEIWRGDEIEAIHYASVAVVDRHGNLTHALGNPHEFFFTRSSIKPFQAMPLVLAGGIERYGLTNEELALTCASHNGSDRHQATAKSILAKAENPAEALLCGSHWPLEMRLNRQFPHQGEDQDPTRHNCSGKHAGFLALAKLLGESTDSYLDPESEVQTRIRAELAHGCQFDEASMPRGTDGCSAPNYSMPLVNLAIGFMRFATGQADSEARRDAMTRLRNAIWEFPIMVSGEKRIDYDLARSWPNNIINKIGAEAIEGIGLADPGIGIAVKIHDGNERALGPVIVEVMRQLGLVDSLEDYPFLVQYVDKKLFNYRRLQTGRIRATFTLSRV